MQFKRRMSGFSCTMKVSRFSIYCGVYAHMKFKSIPIIEQAVNVAASDCETYYRRKVFQTPDRQNCRSTNQPPCQLHSMPTLQRRSQRPRIPPRLIRHLSCHQLSSRTRGTTNPADDIARRVRLNRTDRPLSTDRS